MQTSALSTLPSRERINQRMNQEERTRRSRAKLLEAALELFSRRGYRGTSVRDIADEAGVSTGNLYHQFPDKETIFRTLLDDYWAELASPEHPLNRALAEGAFPDNLEALGRAAREGVDRYRRYIALIYVDVVEFEGQHIRKFYQEMAERFEHFAKDHPQVSQGPALRDGLSPGFGVMLASRIFLQYFAVEILFGVPDHFGRASDEVIHEIAGILRRGMLAEPEKG